MGRIEEDTERSIQANGTMWNHSVSSQWNRWRKRVNVMGIRYSEVLIADAQSHDI